MNFFFLVFEIFPLHCWKILFKNIDYGLKKDFLFKGKYFVLAYFFPIFCAWLCSDDDNTSLSLSKLHVNDFWIYVCRAISFARKYRFLTQQMVHWHALIAAQKVQTRFQFFKNDPHCVSMRQIIIRVRMCNGNE